MSSAVETLFGMMTGKSNQKKYSSPQEEEKATREEFANATSNYNNVSRNTNDKAKLKEAYDRLDSATRAMGKYH